MEKELRLHGVHYRIDYSVFQRETRPGGMNNSENTELDEKTEHVYVDTHIQRERERGGERDTCICSYTSVRN